MMSNKNANNRIIYAVIGICALGAAVGCSSPSKNEDEKPGGDSTGYGQDTESDSDDVDSDTGGGAVANFCHNIVSNDDTITLYLVIGEGDEEIILSAETGECAASLEDHCEAVPVGDEIYYALEDDNGAAVETGTMNIISNHEYYFTADIDDDGELELRAYALNEGYYCKDVECYEGLYTESTCHEDDPCGWAGDDFCDDFCMTIVDTMFDDSADCVENDSTDEGADGGAE
jgi:hypothetical protein